MASEYKIHSRHYLARAKQQLALGTAEALFYSALELRCGIEARMRQYLDPHTHVPNTSKKAYQAGKLDKSIQEAFGGTHRVARFIVLESESTTPRATYYYTPITTELTQIAERLGDYLHAQRTYRASTDRRWQDLRGLLEVGIALLEDANFGKMLGPPLLDHSTGACLLVVEVDTEEGPAAELATIGQPGESVEFHVAYFDSLADARGDAA